MKTLADYEQKFDKLRDECPVRAALDVIRGRWKPSILWELSTGKKRFTDILSALPHATPQAMTVQLRQLEADGVIQRHVFAEVPVRVEYQLTDQGWALSTVMEQLEKWGEGYLKKKASV